MRVKKLVFGIGVMDADYITQINENLGYTEEGKKIQKMVWVCPFYVKWKSMLERCYSDRWRIKHPTYQDVSCVPEWIYFTAFKSWMENQDWEGKHLDKDILFPGNKVYGPETCVFVDQAVNSFLTECTASRGEWPIGVSFDKKKGKYKATCSQVTTRKNKNIGFYSNPEEAHQAWLEFKREQAKILAAQQTDPRVSKALIERYENYQEFNKRGKPL